MVLSAIGALEIAKRASLMEAEALYKRITEAAEEKKRTLLVHEISDGAIALLKMNGYYVSTRSISDTTPERYIIQF